jgi:hypothetical protein
VSVVILAAAAIFGGDQLRQIRRTRDAEFLQNFEHVLRNEKQVNTRRLIYVSVPHPYSEKQKYQEWLQKIDDSPNYYKIESAIYQIDRVAFLIKKTNLDLKLVLELWFDVIARLTLLLQGFIRREINRRGQAYAENFRWLAAKNLEYIKDERSHMNPPVRLLRGNKRTPIPISIEDLTIAIQTIN